MAKTQSTGDTKMMATMWSSRDSYDAVGMQKGSATLEDSVAVVCFLQNDSYHTTPAMTRHNELFDICSEELKMDAYTETWPWMLIDSYL